MRILIACETSGAVRNAFRALRHDAFSCDLLPAAQPSPCHLQMDAIDAIRGGMEGEPWDLVIAHPPCTHLSSSGARWWKEKLADGRQQAGVLFFMKVVVACREVGARFAIENPIGIMSTIYQKPNQIIQPWQFGHGETKATCLWLSGLPCLTPTAIVPGRHPACHLAPDSKGRWQRRSATYPGIAAAMAAQWGAA